MQTSIPAKKFANITPSVLSAGGAALELVGLTLTENPRVPMGLILDFANADDVGTYFGLSSSEFAYAQVYFASFDTSTAKPAALKFVRYNDTAAAAFVRGGDAAAAHTLAQLQAITPGPLTVSVDGHSVTTANINLSTATSFSNAATIIEAALSAATSTGVCTYDSISGAFVITSGTTGNTSSVVMTDTAFSAAIYMTAATGLVTSPGAAAADPQGFMASVAAGDQSWASFTTIWEPTDVQSVGFATWTSLSGSAYGCIIWDTDVQATQQGNTACIGAVIKAADYSGVSVIYQPTNLLQHAFAAGVAASVDYTQQNSRTVFAYRFQSGMTPGVFDETTADILEANGYNYYCASSTRTTKYDFFYPGSINGPFKFMDSYFGQIWLNAGLQDAAMLLMTQVPRIPYTDPGYAMISLALADPIQAGLNAGVIVPNVPLSNAQRAAVNAAAGLNVADTLSARGWYLRVVPAAAGVRATRASPTVSFWYMDGESIQVIDLSSINVQ